MTLKGRPSKWQAAPEELTRAFAAQLAGIPHAEPRKMFGYLAGFVHGRMFAGIFESSVILKLSDPDRAEFASSHGGAPFEPMPGRTMGSFVVVPPSMLAKPALLATWLARAAHHVALLAPKPTSRPKPDGSVAHVRKAPSGTSRRAVGRGKL